MAAYTQGTSNQLTPKRWDTLLHEQVQNKSFFKNMIGKDKGGEGSLDDEVANKPIVEKTQLGKESGDQITMGLIRQTYTGDSFNKGVTANEALVDAEQSLVFHNLAVKIAHQRDGVLVQGKLTLKRSPFDLLAEAKNRLSNTLSKILDDSLFFAIYGGYSPNVFRELGTSVAAPTAHPNSVFGKDRSALTAVDSTDVVDTDMLERIAVAVKENNINPIMYKGKETYGFIIHPRGKRTLRADSHWVDANAFGLPRGDENPIFSWAEGEWAGIYVMVSNKIDTARNYAGLTVASSPTQITLSAATVGSGVAATDLRMNILLGANAVARAYSLESYMARRKEDDYENKFGFGGGFIYGDRRADWALAQDSGSDGAVSNQSSLVVYSYSPNVNANLSAVWS